MTNVSGPIPACAGEPPPGYHVASRGWAYPRLRGGTTATLTEVPRLTGLSPPARGNRDDSELVRALNGPIPACAGEPRFTASRIIPIRAYPRLRGGTSTDQIASKP